MILEHILRATFRVVACTLREDVLNCPGLPRVSFSGHSGD